MNEREYYSLVILCESTEKPIYFAQHECDSLQDVARILLTYKPKKTYEISKVEIELQLKLV